MPTENDDRPTAEPGWRSYRCPVCGHADQVAMSGEESLRIRCSHCDTPLTAEDRGSGESVSVHVSRDETDQV